MKIGDCELIHGDGLEEMQGLRADAIITDPPYGTTACKWDSVIPLDEMWKMIGEVVRSNSPIILFTQTPFDKILGVSNIKNLRYEWIWEKTTATGHLNSNKMPMKAHENILVFYKHLPTYNPQKTFGHKPSNSYTKHTMDGDCYGNVKLGISGGGQTDRFPRSIQIFSSDKQKCRLHPTQKPVELMEYLVKTYTNEGDTVLDFTMGSGTTGVACINTNRKFIGIEKDEEYYKIACNRIKDAYNKSQSKLEFV